MRAGIPTNRTDEARRRLGFAGLMLDLDGCTLFDAQGKPVPLTRGEFAMLQALAQRAGRVMTRDQLLDAVAGRRGNPFDRSVDMMVGRLRRKIEVDPKQPKLIVTVPGIGYKFAASVAASEANLPLPHEPGELGSPSPSASAKRDRPATATEPLLPPSRRRRMLAAGAILAGVAAAGGMAAWIVRDLPPAHPVTITVLPFENLSGDHAQDYFAKGVAIHLAIQLGTFPAIQASTPPVPEEVKGRDGIAAAGQRGADFALKGEVFKGSDRVRITAQLFDTRTGLAIWSDRFDASGNDVLAIQEDVADRIYQSISGWHGMVYKAMLRDAWRKSTPTLEEYDYVLRGHTFYLHFTKGDILVARQIWQEGLRAFPHSALLRSKLAWTFLWFVINMQTDDITADTEQAWKLVQEAERIEPKSPLVALIDHWALAFLHQFRGEDFRRSLTEAHAAVQLMPFDPFLRNDMSLVLANAGELEEAIDWAHWSIRHDPAPQDWYFGNLGWAYYLAQRYDEAMQATEKTGGFEIQRAAILVRLGRTREARAVIGEWLKSHPGDTIAAQALYPLIEPHKRALLDDLRAAGLPER